MKAWNIRGSKPKKNPRSRRWRGRLPNVVGARDHLGFLANHCDGLGPHGGPNEVRLYPLGGGGNAILCRACFVRENTFNRERGFAMKDWNTAKVYANEIQKNPKRRRTRVQRRANVLRDSRGVIARIRFKPSRVKRGHLARTKENAYRRMMRPPIRGLSVQRVRAAKRVRKNPEARRRSFVVSAKTPHQGAAFHQIAAFTSKPQALDYARALSRMNRRATIKVEKR